MKVSKKSKWTELPELTDMPEGNPFIEGFIEWMGTPQGQLSIEAIDLLHPLLEKLQLDAKARKILWTDGEQLTIDESVKRMHVEYPELPAEVIEEKLISWLEMEYEPKGASEKQLDELDRLTEAWIDDHERKHRRA